MPIIVGGKTKESKSITVIEPDKLQAVASVIPVFIVEADEFPRGITIQNLYLKTSAASSLGCSLRKYATPTDASPDYIVSADTSSSTESNSVPFSVSGSVGTSEILMITVPNVNVDWMQVTVFFSEN